MSNPSRPEIVVITGASAGLGRAIAHEFAQRGVYIGLLARGEESLQGTWNKAEPGLLKCEFLGNKRS